MRFLRATHRNIYVKSKRAGERVLESVKKYVENRLKLKVNMAKSAVDRPWKRKFLGFSFTWEKNTRIRIAPKSIERLKEKVRKITSRSNGLSVDIKVSQLAQYLRGWMGYFALADTPTILSQLDEWIRRRLRMCLLKEWKKPKTRRRKLVGLGIPIEWARLISGSRKGYWRLANTPQMNKALGLAYWREQGLVSLIDRYREIRSTT